MANQITTKNLSLVTYRTVPVVATEMLALLYKTEQKYIRQNYSRNEDRFVRGKHFYKVENEELNQLRASQRGLQISPKTRSLILWTERGAARHAKILETDQAWEVFEQLEDCYFNAERANNPPRYQPEAREPLTSDDTSHLARLIWGMKNGFRFECSWSNAIWHALRYVAGVSSPQHFGVSHVPILTEEFQRIYSFTNALKEVLCAAESKLSGEFFGIVRMRTLWYQK